MANSRRSREAVASEVHGIVLEAIAESIQLEYVTQEMLDRAAEAVAALIMHSYGLIDDDGPEQTVMINPTPDWEFRRAGQ